MAQPMDLSKRKSSRQKTTDSAKKRKKHVANTAINQQRVYIGSCLERCTAVKDQNGPKTHMEVAMLLLDSYDAYKVMLGRKKLEPLAKSTPQKPETQEEKILHGESSEPVSITGQSEISGLHPISSSEAETHESLSLSSSVDSSNDEENSDEDYETSSDICMRDPVEGVDISFAGEDFERTVFDKFCQSFNKKSARWTVRPVKEQKTYPHMATLIRNVFQLRLSADKPLSSVLGLAKSDPQRISMNIAPVEPPSKKELIEQFKSRYSKNY